MVRLAHNLRVMLAALAVLAALGPNAAAAAPQAASTASVPPVLTFDQVPDLVDYVAIVVPQCNQCNPDGQVVLPPKAEPQSASVWDALFPFRWLGWAIEETIRKLLCWLLWLAQLLANAAAGVANVFIGAANSAWRLAVVLWTNLRSGMYSLWLGMDELRLLLGNLAAHAHVYLLAFVDIVLLLLGIIAQIGQLLLDIVLGLIGVLSWIGAVSFTFLAEVIAALRGTDVPEELRHTHIVYFAVRGAAEGIMSSKLAIVYTLLVAMAYFRFLVWLTRYLSNSAALLED